MPKMKSNGGAKKRFKLTGTGKVKRSKSGKRHLLACKATGRKRKLRKLAVGSASEENRVKRMLPYV